MVLKTRSLSLLLLLVSLFAKAQTDSLQWTGNITAHPRILMLKDEEAGIKAGLAANKQWMKIHQLILSEADNMLSAPALERKLVGRRLLATSRECLRRVFFLSYAWRMTQKDKYAKRAEAEMLTVSAFQDWNHPQHFLDVAEMTMAVSIGYDWLYNYLPEQSRSIIKEAILKKGIEPSLDRKYNGWLTGTNNWNQVCNAGMVYGAMAIFEDTPRLAVSIINRAVKSVGLCMNEEYAPDGAYPEGYGYWAYGTVFNVMLISAFDKLFGTDFGLSQKQGFLQTPYYMENMMGPNEKSFNYSDVGSGWEPQPAMAWFAQKLKDPSLLWMERSQFNSDKPNKFRKERMMPAFMVWGTGVNLDKISPPSANMFTGGGKNPVAMMRSSWTDKNAIYLGLKAGTPNESHAHMDVGSFVMDADGVRWAMDFGMQDYESLESKKVDLWNMKQASQRWQVFRYNNFVHNTLSVNFSLQKVEGRADITSHSNTPKFMNATTDITDLYKGDLAKANRGVAIVNKEYVVVRDELETNDKEAFVRWTMLTPATVNIINNHKAELSKDGKTLTLQIIEPADAKITILPAPPMHDYDAANPGTLLVGFEIRLPANTKQPVTVLLLPQGSESQATNEIKPLAEWPK